MHSDPELLGLIALGEHVGTDDEVAHAHSCPDCAAELAELHRLAVLGRSVDSEIAMAIPSPDVWIKIREELGFTLPLEWSANAQAFPSSPTAKVAEAAGVSDRGLTAHAHLAPVASRWEEASGTAELATDERGRRVLQVDLHAHLPNSGVRQAWLIHRDDDKVRQTLGILDGRHGLWTIDQSIDLREFPMLDISQQRAGETEHSGQTIVRGQLILAG